MTVKNILSKNWLPLPYGDPKMGSRHLLRRSFILREDQKGGAVSVTAGSVYRLYVNGKTVMAGPARGTSGYFFYDTVEIGGYLRPGPNVIALETAYFPNNVPETIQYEFPLHEPGISVCLELSGINEAPQPLLKHPRNSGSGPHR